MALSHFPRVVTDGLQAYYDAGSFISLPSGSSTFYDISKNSRDTALVGSPTHSLEEKYISFGGSGSGQYGLETAFSFAAATDTMTIEVAFRCNLLPSNQYETGCVYGGAIGNNHMVFLYPKVSDSSSLGMCVDDSRYNEVHRSSASVAEGEWVIFTMAGKPGGTAGQWKYWVNGELDRDFFEAQQPVNPTTNNWYMARGSRGYTNPFGGAAGNNFMYTALDISYLLRYNRELSDKEVKQNFVSMRGRVGL